MPESVSFAPNKLLTVLPRGGDIFILPVQRITKMDLPALESCANRWPQENQTVIDAIKDFFTREPAVEQYLACETAFFHTLPEAASEYALPRSQRAAGLRRFGVDGLFHEWVAKHFANDRNIVSVHLTGNTTLSAIRAGKAVDTSGGYSLLEGLPGMTTCGEIDPSLVLFLNEQGFRWRKLLHCSTKSLAGVP
jgi:acetate kinase